MKKAILLSTMLAGSLAAFSQNHYAKQYFFTSGGYSFQPGNRVKVGIVERGAQTVSYIDSVLGDFSNVVNIYHFPMNQPSLVKVEGIAHVGRATGNDLLVRYDLETYNRLDSVQTSGVQAVARNSSKLVVAKGFGATGDYVDILDATNLTKLASVPSITNECTSVKIVGDSAYVAHSLKSKISTCLPYSCFQDSIGYLSIIDLKTNQLAITIDLGTKGAGINKLFIRTEADQLRHVYFSNLKDSLYQIVDNSAIHSVGYTSVLAVTDNYIYGLKNTGPTLTAVNINKNNDQLEEKPTRLDSVSFAYGLYATYDTVSNKYLVLKPSYTTDGWLVRFAAGQDADSIKVGVSTTAIAIDYAINRTTSFLSNTNSTKLANVYPNPCKDVLTVNNSDNASTWQINTLQGQALAKGQMNNSEEKISTESLAKGVYYLVLNGNAIVSTTKFVKE